jgi:hypothetical protein
MDSTITARVIRALEYGGGICCLRSLLLGQKIIIDTSNKIKNWKYTQFEQFQNQISRNVIGNRWGNQE